MKILLAMLLVLLLVPAVFAQPAFLTTAESFHLPLYAFDSAGVDLVPPESLFVVVYDQDGDSVYTLIGDTTNAATKGPYLRRYGNASTANEYTYFATVGTLDGTTGGVGLYRVEIMLWNSSSDVTWRVAGSFYEVATSFNTTLARLDETISTRSAIGDTIQREASTLITTDNIGLNWGDITNPTGTSPNVTANGGNVATINSLSPPTNWNDMAILVTTGEVGIDLDNTQGTISGGEIALTPTEFTPAYAEQTEVANLDGWNPGTDAHLAIGGTISGSEIALTQTEFTPDYGVGTSTFDNTTDSVIVDGSSFAATDNIITMITLDSSLMYMAYGGGIWIDESGGSAGAVVGLNGTSANPTTSFTDARILADSIGVQRYYLINNTSLTLAATHEHWEFIGVGLANLINLGDQDVDSSHFTNLSLFGSQGGTNAIIAEDCFLSGTDSLTIFAENCWISGNLTLSSTDSYFNNCKSAVAGGATPTIAFDGSGTTDLSFRHYSGGVEFLTMVAGDVMSYEADGQAIFNVNCTGGSASLRGNMTVTNNGSTTITDDAVFSNAIGVNVTEIASGATSPGNLDEAFDGDATGSRMVLSDLEVTDSIKAAQMALENADAAIAPLSIVATGSNNPAVYLQSDNADGFQITALDWGLNTDAGFRISGTTTNPALDIIGLAGGLIDMTGGNASMTNWRLLQTNASNTNPLMDFQHSGTNAIAMNLVSNKTGAGVIDINQNNSGGAALQLNSSGTGIDIFGSDYAIEADRGMRFDVGGDTALALIASGATGMGLVIDNETGDTSITVHDDVNYTGNINVTNDINGKIALHDSLNNAITWNALYNGLGGSALGAVSLNPIGEFNKDTANVTNAAGTDTLFQVIYIRNGGDGTPVDTIRFIRP